MFLLDLHQLQIVLKSYMLRQRKPLSGSGSDFLLQEGRRIGLFGTSRGSCPGATPYFFQLQLVIGSI